MKELIEVWYKSFFLTPLIAILSLIVLTISFKKRKNIGITNYLPIYLLSLFLLFSIPDITFLFIGAGHVKRLDNLETILDYFFTILEMLVLGHFLFSSIKNTHVRKIILFFCIGFVLFAVPILLIRHPMLTGITRKTRVTVYTSQSALLFIPCCFYFIELFRSPKGNSLRSNPVFWINTGVFIFLMGALPFSIMELWLIKYFKYIWAEVYFIYYALYIFLLIFIIKAYCCKTISKISAD